MTALIENFWRSSWAMERSALRAMFAAAARRDPQAAAGGDVNARGTYALRDSVATIPIIGTIVKRSDDAAGWWYSAACACEDVRASMEQALSNPRVKSIVLDVDSPGGCVDGVGDLSDFIFKARGKKPITAFANGQMASAAYYIASAADRIVCSQDAGVGSIGVYCILQDYSEWLKKIGINEEMIKAGKYKGLGHPDFPINEDTRRETQREIDSYYELFVNAVARNRGLKTEDARKLADGRHHIGAEAVKVRLADAVGTLDSLGAVSIEGVSLESAAPSATGKVTVFQLSKPAAKSDGTPPAQRKESSKMAIENVLAELNLEDFTKLRPDLVARIRTDAVTAERERSVRITALISESGIENEAHRGILTLRCATLSVEAAGVEIGRFSAIEGALTSARLSGLEEKEVNALRGDVGALPAASAVSIINQVVNAKNGVAKRLVNSGDQAMTGKDIKSPVADVIKTARAEFSDPKSGLKDIMGLTEKDYVMQSLEDAKQANKALAWTNEELMKIAPDLFK